MATVYIVTRGEYSDYGIQGVFSTRELAEAFMARFVGDWDTPQIEEWELDPAANALREGWNHWFIRMSREGTATECRIESPSTLGDGFDVHGNMYTHVWARDNEHAIKIANERRTVLVATGQWGKQPA